MFLICLVIVSTLTGLALVYAGLLTLHGWECRRFVRSRLGCDIFENGPAATRVAVLAPCKGADPDQEQNLRALFEQDYGQYAILFIVESEDDEAVPLIRRLIDEHPHVSAHLFEAGRATTSGQKVHNLLTATEQLSDQFEILAFTDADARHNPTWLRGLVEHLFVPGTGASTGYRWIVPQRLTLANLLLYSINSSVAGLYGRGETNYVWGGSWAIQRHVFDQLGMQDAWRGTLSDDMVARGVIRKAGLHIEFEPRCIAATPADVTLGGLFEFLRRQHLIGRRHAPHYWLPAMLANIVSQMAIWGNLFTAGYGLLTGWSWWWAPAGAGVALYGLGVLRGWLRQDAGRRMLPSYAPRLAAARRFDIWAGPLAGLANCAGMLAAIIGNTVTWRGNRYRIGRGGRIRLLYSDPALAPEEPQEATCRRRVFPAPEPNTQRLRRSA